MIKLQIKNRSRCTSTAWMIWRWLLLTTLMRRAIWTSILCLTTGDSALHGLSRTEPLGGRSRAKLSPPIHRSHRSHLRNSFHSRRSNHWRNFWHNRCWWLGHESRCHARLWSRCHGGCGRRYRRLYHIFANWMMLRANCSGYEHLSWRLRWKWITMSLRHRHRRVLWSASMFGRRIVAWRCWTGNVDFQSPLRKTCNGLAAKCKLDRHWISSGAQVEKGIHLVWWPLTWGKNMIGKTHLKRKNWQEHQVARTKHVARATGGKNRISPLSGACQEHAASQLQKISQEHHKCKEAESLESQMLYQSITVSTATNSSNTSGKNMVICSSQEHHRWQDHEASFNVKRLPILISLGIGKSLAVK